MQALSGRNRKRMNVFLVFVILFSILGSVSPVKMMANEVEEPEKPSLMISKIVPDTDSSEGGPDGYELVEIYNTTEEDINLSGYTIDYSGSATPWSLGEDTIGAKDFLYVWAKREGNPEPTERFANFWSIDDPNKVHVVPFNGINDVGPRTLTIVDPEGTEISSATYPENEYERNRAFIFGIPEDGGTTLELLGTKQRVVTGTIGLPPEEPAIIFNKVVVDTDSYDGRTDAYEMVELYNNSDSEINLKDYTFDISGVTRTLEDQTIAPGEFAYLWTKQENNGQTMEGYAEYWEIDANDVQVVSFGGLNDVGPRTLSLTDPQGNLVSTATYPENEYERNKAFIFGVADDLGPELELLGTKQEVVPGRVGLPPASGDEPIPSLIITKIVPDTESSYHPYTGEERTDAYEMIEIYNTTDEDINLSGYAIDYSSASTDWPLGTHTIPANGFSYLWTKQEDNQVTFEEYAAFWGLDELYIDSVTFGGMFNTGPRSLTIVDPEGNEISTATYPIDENEENKAFIFGVPEDGTKNLKLLGTKQEVVPGTVGLPPEPEPEPEPEPYAVDVTVKNEVTGQSPELVGLVHGHWMPDTNVKQWVEYSGINVLRVWTRANNFTKPEDAESDESIQTAEDFDAKIAQLREDPENSGYIDMNAIMDRFENQLDTDTNWFYLDHMMKEINDLGIRVYGQLSLDSFFDDNAIVDGEVDWNSVWNSWQRYYGMVYLMAKHYDVENYSFANEPDWRPNHNGVTIENYTLGLQVTSDAMRAAIEDVNRNYDKNLVPEFTAPVLAQDPSFMWGRVPMQKIRTDYAGRTVDYDIFNIFANHRYNATADQYTEDIQNLREMMAEEHPEGETLPIVYTEFGRHTANIYSQRDATMNTPYVYTDLAGIYGAMAEEGIHGMIGQKFSNTDKAGGVPDDQAFIGHKGGHYDVENFVGTDTSQRGTMDTMGSRKGGETYRLFTKAFKDSNDMLATEVTTESDYTNYRVSSSFDEDDQNYYIWSTSTHKEKIDVDFDLSSLDVNENTIITIEEVSEHHNGEVKDRVELTDPSSLELTHAPQSVWLLTVPKGDNAETTINSQKTSSEEPIVQINHAEEDKTVGYVEFDMTSVNEDANRAVLWVEGQNNDNGEDYKFHVYAVNNAEWNGDGEIPNIGIDSNGRVEPTDDTYMVGTLTYDGEKKYAGVDFTQFVKKHDYEDLTFVLIREKMHPEDWHDNSYVDVDLSSAYLEITSDETVEEEPISAEVIFQLLEQLKGEEAISKQAAHQLTKALENAEHHNENGRDKQANHHLDRFINIIDGKQSNHMKNVSDEVKELLRNKAEDLREEWF